MARLILDENGKRRAFKLNNGRLVIGSGQGSALRLQSEDVADVHAELEITPEGIRLIPKPGVMPPKLFGRPVLEPTRLAPNAEFSIGSAVLHIESDEAPAPSKASAGGRAGVARAVTGGRETSPAAARPERSRGVTHRRRTISKGIPTPVILGVIGAIAVTGYFTASSMFGGASDEIDWDPGERYRTAVLAYAEGGSKRASDELDNVDLERADPELRIAVAELRKKIANTLEQGVIAEHNVKGTGWLDSNIKKYVEMYLSGERATRARARLFVKRCDEFKLEYPRHPELGWVDRHRKRYAKLADMRSPAEFDDVDWEVKRLTAAKPRDYALVFRLMDAYTQTNPGGPSTPVGILRAKMVVERDEYFLDRMQQSRYHWEKEQYGSAVEWLVQVIIQIGDKGMEDQAIDFFLKMQTKAGVPLARGYFESYKQNRSKVFETLMTFPRLRASAQAAGVL